MPRIRHSGLCLPSAFSLGVFPRRFPSAFSLGVFPRRSLPLVGEFRSNQIGVFTGSAIILVIACFTIRWIGANRTSERLTVGILWLLLTVAFEVLFGRFVMRLTWERIGADYNVLQGGLMPLGLLVLFLSPMIAAKLRARR